jgi:hypothetical protein
MELCEASDCDLVNYYKSLQKLNDDCEKLHDQLKELGEAALPCETAGASSRRAQDSSIGWIG